MIYANGKNIHKTIYDIHKFNWQLQHHKTEMKCS